MTTISPILIKTLLFVFRKGKFFHFSLQPTEPFLKGRTGLFLCIKIYKDMSHGSGMRMNWEQWIVGFIKSLDIIHLRRLDEFPGSIIGPAVILAAHDKGISLGLLEDGKRSMTTNIVEASDGVVLPLDEEKGEPGDVEGTVRTGLLEMRSVGGVKPGLLVSY